MGIETRLLSIGLVVASTAASAAEGAVGVPQAERQSLSAFAAANASCEAWSDGCIVCRRQGAQGFACSTPGIACRPSALACQNPGRDTGQDPGKSAH